MVKVLEKGDSSLSSNDKATSGCFSVFVQGPAGPLSQSCNNMNQSEACSDIMVIEEINVFIELQTLNIYKSFALTMFTRNKLKLSVKVLLLLHH